MGLKEKLQCNNHEASYSLLLHFNFSLRPPYVSMYFWVHADLPHLTGGRSDIRLNYRNGSTPHATGKQ